MRVVIQRVSRASLNIDGSEHCKIDQGMVVLAGFEGSDNSEDIDWIVGKISKIRIFDDRDGVMNLSVDDIGGEIMAVSQFTLMAATRRGNRPSYIKAAEPSISIPLYESFLERLGTAVERPVKSGVFGADMKVELVNDGPVTIIIDSKHRE